jgi:hypothetical protein
MNLSTLFQAASFVVWAVIGLVLGRNAGEQISMRRVDEEFARLEHREMPIRFSWADRRWLLLTLLSLGGSLVFLGWHRNVLSSLGIFLVTFVICYWWARTRPPARLARMRMQIEYDGAASIRLLRVQKFVMVALGVLMLVLPAPYKYWVIGVGLIFAVLGSLIDTLLIGPAQIRRIQRWSKRLDDEFRK